MPAKIISFLHSRSFPLLLLIVFIMHLATYLVTPIFPIFLEKAGSFSLAQVGLILGVGSIAYQIGSLLGGLASDRLGRRSVMMIGSLLEGTAMAGYSISYPFVLFLLFSVINGLGTGFLAPALKAMIAGLVNESDRTAAFSWRGIAAHLGIIIAGVAITLLAIGVSRSIFLYAAATFAVLALAIRVALPSDRCEGADCEKVQLADYKALWHNRRFVWFSVVSLFIWALYAQFALVMPLRGEHVLGSAARIGLIWTINSTCVVLLQRFLSRFLIERIRPYISLLAGTLLVGSGLFAMGFAFNFVMLSASAVLFIIGEMLLMPVIDSLTGRFAQDELLGAYFGISNFISGVGTAIGTSAGGLLAERLGGLNSHAPWIAYGLAGVICAGFIGLFAYSVTIGKTGTGFKNEIFGKRRESGR